MKRKSWIFLLAGLFMGISLAGVVLAGNIKQNNVGSGQPVPPAVGAPVKDFVLNGLDGKTYTLSGLKGKPVVVNFWATWCPPCKEEMPLLQKYANQYSGKLLVVGVDYAEEKEVVEKFVRENQISFPILLDQSGIVADLYYARNFPTTYFIDGDGVLRAQHLGLLTGDLIDQYLAILEVKP